MSSGSNVHGHRKITKMLFHLCGEKMEKIGVAKAQSELKLARTVGGSRRGFLKYVDSKRQCRNNICDEDGHLKKWNVDIAEI